MLLHVPQAFESGADPSVQVNAYKAPYGLAVIDRAFVP